MTPIITIAIGYLFLSERFSRLTLISLIPVIFGIPLATYGDYSFTNLGLFITVSGAILASIKGIVTNKLQRGSFKFHPLDLLLHMAPLALMQTLAFAILTGEMSEFIMYLSKGKFGGNLGSLGGFVALVMNGVLAFLLNYISFSANGISSPLMMCVAGNMKQVLSIVVSVLIFKLNISSMNRLGICLTLFGGFTYTLVELQSKKTKRKESLLPTNGDVKDSIKSSNK